MYRTLIALVALFFAVASGHAADVGSAKAAGHACEQTDGYLRANSGAPNDVRALVENVNAQRKSHYADIATKNGVTVDQVARLTAEKVIKNAPQHACK